MEFTQLTTPVHFYLLVSSGVGSEIQQPLAVVIIGGLFSSTALTLLVLPTLYRWIYRGEEK